MSHSASGSVERSEASHSRLSRKRKESSRRGSITKEKGKTNRPCRSCRALNLECDGNVPRCINCYTKLTPCDYGFNQKDKLRKVTSQVKEMTALLRVLRLRVLAEERSQIDNLLVTNDDSDTVTIEEHASDRMAEAGGEGRGEADVSAEVGSSTDMDLINEDLLRDGQSRATGFVGKASAVQWLRKLHMEEGIERHDGPYGPPGVSPKAAADRLAALRLRQHTNPTPLLRTSKASYYLDDDIQEADFMVDPFEMPPFATAEKLLQAYMESCHNTFPFLPKKAFVSQFYHYYATLRRGNPEVPSQQWQAALNLVFAIGAVYSHLISAEWRQDERDHLVFYSRATSLGLMNLWWSAPPDLPQMQIIGLLSFYYHSIGRINRAWILIGLATRCGYALGMHIRNEDRSTNSAKKEILARIWWANFSFERYLSATIGRPSLGVDGDCSVPLPLPVPSEDIEEAVLESRFGDEIETSAGIVYERPLTSSGPRLAALSEMPMSTLEPANSGTYLKALVKGFEITQEALKLYDASTISLSWESTQKIIKRLNERLQLWASLLADGLNFSTRDDNVGHRYRREQNSLYIFYHSTLILITRPCLCRLDRRITNQSARSDDFNRQAAGICVASAKALVDYLPDDPDYNVAKIYEASPWWSMVHHIMQSLTVLLLEMTNKASNFPLDQNRVVPALKKQIRWLRAMRSNNMMAKRAYTLVFDLIKKLVLTVDIDIADLLEEDTESNIAATSVANMGFSSEFVHQSGGMESMPTGQTPQHINPSVMNLFASPSNVQQSDISYLPEATATPINTFSNQFPEPQIARGLRYSNMFYTSFDEHNPLLRLSGEDVTGGKEGNKGKD